EAADIAQEAGMHTLVPGADCKRTILDDKQVVALGNGVNAVHVEREAEVVNDADRPRTRRDVSIDLVNRDVAGVRISVGEDDGRAGELNRIRGCDMGLRLHDKLVSGP